MSKWLVLPLLLLFPYVAAAAGGAARRDGDHDRLPDRWEKRYHLSIVVKSAQRDPDHDGLRNLREYRLRTHPRRKDSDGDGLRDGAEVRRYHTNPRKKDTDGDGYGDGFEVRAGMSPRDRGSHPSGSPAPPAPIPAPRSTGFPDASSTGVPSGATLTPGGGLTINAAGAVVDGREITGAVVVNAPNVTIRNSRIRSNARSGIQNNSTGLVIEDVEVDCGNAVGRTAITTRDYTARRVNAHGCENVFWAEGNVLIEDSYIHGPVDYDPVLDPHTDSVQIPAGASNITIRHNTIYGNYVSRSSFGNSAIMMGGNTSNIAVRNNLLAGGGYTVYCNQGGGGAGNSVVDNRFSRIFVATVGGFGPWLGCADEPVVSGNVFHETGEPLRTSSSSTTTH